MYRGEVLSAAELDWYESHVDGLNERPAIISTTQNPDGSYLGNAQFIIQSRTGRRITIYSAKPEQQEVLFGTGSRFRIRAVERSGDSAIIYLVEE